MSTVAKGSRAENFVAAHGRSQGWLVSSLRHEKGGGDQLWMKVGQRSRLVEIKCTPNVWQQFRKVDRLELRDRARAYDLDPLVAQVKNLSGKVPTIRWWTEDEWPSSS